MSNPAFDWGSLVHGDPLFVGILNVTPDSFSDGGRHATPEAALDQAAALIDSGARLLDVGAESTRPGAEPLGPDTEWHRLEPVLQALTTRFPDCPVSLDTRHVEVAARGLALGVAVINDVTGFLDPAMLRLAQETSCGLIAMRSRLINGGLWMPPYHGPGPLDAERGVTELLGLRDRLRSANIADTRILLDPGFGFGTTYPEDLALWRALPALPARLDWPVDRICLGISRKRFLAVRAGSPDLPPLGRDDLTARAHREALAWGYRVFRTHVIG